jgi:Na+/H+-dicarboxylate symporter
MTIRIGPTARVVIGLALGLGLGTAAAATRNATLLEIVNDVAPLGTLWTNAIQMTVIPLVIALLITGVAEVGWIGRLTVRAVTVFLVLLLAGGLFSFLAAPLSIDRLTIAPDVAAALREAFASDTTTHQVPTLVQRVVAIVPANPIRAAADNALLPLVVFTLAFGVGVASLAPERRAPVVALFQAIGNATLTIVGWVLAAAPIGIFALALGLAARLGAKAVPALVHYMVTLSAVLLILTVALYPVALILGRVSLRRFAGAAAPAQLVAFSSRSSLAALPAMIHGARDRLGAPPVITGVALPLAVSVFRMNVPIAWVVGVLFLGKLYGVPIDTASLLGLVVTATLISFSVPGIPSGSLFLLAPVLVGLGLPAEGVGILIALDPIPDMFKTTINVTAHLTAAAILGREGRGEPVSASRPV